MSTAAPLAPLFRMAAAWPELTVRAIERPSGTEVFLTAVARAGAGVSDEAQRLYRLVAEAVAATGLQPLHEKLFGRAGVRAEALALRADAYRRAGLDPTLPCTYMTGAPIHAGDLAGVQVWGLIPVGDRARITTVGAPGEGLARCWTGPGYRLLHFAGIDGLDPASPGRCVTEQAEAMLTRAVAALAHHGLTLTDVPRTWITMARILDWYGEFNRVRTGFFQHHGVGADAERSFPASTGIQGQSGGEECLLELLAVDGAGARTTPIHASSRQQRAFDYGSAFSRAAAVDLEGRETIFVSGTASLDSAGRTLHTGDAELQILETLLCIGALLETRGATLRDLRQATLFCKTPAVYEGFVRVSALLGLPALPAVPVVADVCRPELLVEIEAVAAAPQEAHP